MPGDPSSAAFIVAAAILVRGSRVVVQGRGAQLDPHRLPADRASGWARVIVGDLEQPGTRGGRRAGRRARRGRRRRSRARWSSPTRCRSRSTSSRWWRCSARYADGRDRGARRRGAAPEGVRPDRRRGGGAARPRRRHRGHRRTASSCAATARRCAAARSTRAATTGMAMLGAVAGLASDGGGRRGGDGRRRGVLPRLRAGPPRARVACRAGVRLRCSSST